jgi:2-haloacid dehalogenase
VFDFCDVLLDWQPRKTLEGQYPTDVIDTFFDPADEYGFEHYDKLSDGGWSRKCILDDYENHHGAALSRVFRTYFDRYRLSLAGMQPGMDSLVRNLIDAGIGVGG